MNGEKYLGKYLEHSQCRRQISQTAEKQGAIYNIILNAAD